MLLPVEKERESRFKLALRMGFPIVLLASILIFSLLSQYLETIPHSFIIIAVGIFAVMVYFIFYLIYQGFEERITDPITHMFTREYAMAMFEKEVRDGPYSLVMITIDNLSDINERYGVNNGDMILYETAQWIGRFFESKGLKKFPIAHLRGGEFLIGFHGEKHEHKNSIDLLCLKAEQLLVNDIEIQLNGAIVDNGFSKNISHMIDYLVEKQSNRREARSVQADDEQINPDLLESKVIEAVRSRRISLKYQSVVGKEGFLDVSVKLMDEEGKILHQKNTMPVINRLGLGSEYDTMLLEEVIDVASAHPERSFSLTLSPSSLRHLKLLEKFRSLANGNVARRLIFVLGEKEYYGHIRRYNDILQAYRETGVRIAIDNVGSYQTSMLYMKDLDADMIRIDNRYAKRMDNERYIALIAGFQASAKALGLDVWIGMVSDEKTACAVEELGIDYKQGNYFGKIVSMEELEKEDDEIR